MAKFTRKQITVEAIELLYPTTITTTKGVLKGQAGDYIVHTNGEQFIVAKDIFEMTYQASGNPDTLAPLEVGNLDVKTVTDSAITISFMTPADADFDHYVIYQDGLEVRQGTAVGEVLSNIANLSPATPYTIKVTTVDTSGNESTGVTVVATTEPALLA